MISGVSSNDGFSPRFITGVRALTSAPRPAAQSAIEATEPVAEFATPSGDQDQLSHDFTMLDLASRQFTRILPEIEAVTSPVE